MSIRERVLAGFEAAAATLRADPPLAPVLAAIDGQRARYLRKMSVALVGRVSSGKSTLANALLGGAYAPTGIQELTFNVNWLRHGSTPGLTVHFDDGREPEPRDRAELERLTVRAHDDPALQRYLSDIAYLEVRDPNAYLESFDLVDTPGLDSHLADDSRKTMAFLDRTAEGVRAATIAHASRADALVLVFSGGIAATDAELVGDFVRAGFAAASPITAVGALTKVELYWPDRDPMTEGRRNAARLMAAGGRRLLFDVHPVASLVAAGAAVFTDDHFEDLRKLSTVDGRVLRSRLTLGGFFATRPYPELPVEAPRRRALLELFGGYGVELACGLLRDGVDTPDELRAALVDRSGLRELRRALFVHFATRADVIKLRHAVDELHDLPRRAGSELGLDPRERDTVARAAAELTQLAQEPAFAELDALRRHYLGELEFTEAEGEELRRLAGEAGTRLAERLGAPPDTGIDELEALARRRHAYWSAVAAGRLYQGVTWLACRVMLRGYDRALSEAVAARRAAR